MHTSRGSPGCHALHVGTAVDAPAHLAYRQRDGYIQARVTLTDARTPQHRQCGLGELGNWGAVPLYRLVGNARVGVTWRPAEPPKERRASSRPEAEVLLSLIVTRLTRALDLVSRNLDRIRATCKRRGVSFLELVGSAARDDFDPARSDIDVLVDFPDGATDLFDSFMGLREDLSEILGRPVAVITVRGIRNVHFLDSLRHDSIRLYAA